MTVYKVGVLGCTGTVGQRFVQLLENHPFFRIHALGASSRSAGKVYRDALTKWLLDTSIPDDIASKTVTLCEAKGALAECDLVFSALDSSVAHDVELEFANAGIPVFSNAKNHRMGTKVPLIVPTANPEHIHLVREQSQFKNGGYIVCNANCTSTGLVTVLAPLHAKYPIKQMHVTSMQAVSGAGYPGLSVMDLLDNVVPYISDEEDKVETEPAKILGQVKDGSLTYANFQVSAHCNRVPVVDGHTVCVSIKFAGEGEPAPPSPEQVEATLREWNPFVPGVAYPSMPQTVIHVKNNKDAPPQPRLDRARGNGFTVTAGRVRDCPLMDIKLVCVSHNTVIGAAGSAVLNAEVAKYAGYINAKE